MEKKAVLRVLVIITLLYPAYMLFLANTSLNTGEVLAAQEDILGYRISVWIIWVFLVSVAVFFKWTEKKNFFFYFTYAYLGVAFGLYGYLHQDLVNTFDLPSSFDDNYTLGILVALQNLIVSIILTAFLQAGVWWFTRRWHRR